MMIAIYYCNIFTVQAPGAGVFVDLCHFYPSLIFTSKVEKSSPSGENAISSIQL